jgi:hypothetical protein
MVKVKKQTMIQVGVALAVILVIWLVLKLKRNRTRRVIVTAVPTLAQMKPLVKAAEKYEDDEEEYVDDEEYYVDEETEGYAEYANVAKEPYTQYADATSTGDLLE